MTRLGERDPQMAGGKCIAPKPPVICSFAWTCWQDGKYVGSHW
jgi:hypothetical protein